MKKPKIAIVLLLSTAAHLSFTLACCSKSVVRRTVTTETIELKPDAMSAYDEPVKHMNLPEPVLPDADGDGVTDQITVKR